MTTAVLKVNKLTVQLFNRAGNSICRWSGLSADEKPIIGGYGSTFYEEDTRVPYIFVGSGWVVDNRRLRHLIRDLFLTDYTPPLPATFPMSPGPGIWTPTDTQNKIAITSSWANFTAQGGSPAYANQMLVCANVPIVRQAGQIIMYKYKCTTDGEHYPLALVDSATPGLVAHSNVIHGFFRSGALKLSSVDNEAIGMELITNDSEVPFVANGTEYWLIMVLQATGCYYLYALAAAPTVVFFCRFSEVATQTPLYVAAAGHTGEFSITHAKAPVQLWTGDLVAES